MKNMTMININISPSFGHKKPFEHVFRLFEPLSYDENYEDIVDET